MRAADVRRGLRVRVIANNASGAKQGGGGDLVPGDTIVLDRIDGNRVIYKLNNGSAWNDENYMNLGDLELIKPRKKSPPKVDVWEASRGYIRN